MFTLPFAKPAPRLSLLSNQFELFDSVSAYLGYGIRYEQQLHIFLIDTFVFCHYFDMLAKFFVVC